MFKFLDSLDTLSEVPVCRNCKHHGFDTFSRHICRREQEENIDPVTGWVNVRNTPSCESERKKKFFNLFSCGYSGFYFEPKEESK